MTSEKLIERLCSAFGPSGREEAVAGLIKKEISDICPNAVYDRMGNLIAVMRFGDTSAEKRKRVMISAHMDEVGFMINEIKSNGTLGFDTVGGINESVMAGRRVSVLGEGGLMTGIIASKAIHHKDKKEREKAVKTEKLYIDIGAADGDEAKKYVSVGDFAVFDSPFYTFGEGLVKAKALDDRMGCAAMIQTMRALKKQPPEGDLDACFCFTVREEIGLSGAKAAAYRIKPDIAIVLETTAIADIEGVDPSGRVADVGGGVVVSVMDRSTIYCRPLVDLALRLGKQKGIKAQVKRYVSGGNDAGTIHKTGEGVKTVALSVPTRYLHSPACVASMEDYHSQQRLCEEILRAVCSTEEI
ncbi:MAG: M20/M25/M40 family metallo-hydrolase [Clostridia bacterium]|nr:M20/M25/M40 family metallo-hydrolase [Clostridia bacterium]